MQFTCTVYRLPRNTHVPYLSQSYWTVFGPFNFFQYQLGKTYLKLLFHVLKRHIFTGFATSLSYASFVTPLYKFLFSLCVSYPIAGFGFIFKVREFKSSHGIQFAKVFFLNAVWKFGFARLWALQAPPEKSTILLQRRTHPFTIFEFDFGITVFV
jgi:hypothetical protein